MTIGRDQSRCLLITRPLEDGRADVLLRLYRDGQPASKTLVSTLKEDKARMVLLMARMQLFRLGHEEHVPRMPQVTAVQIEAA